jgi:hypothetical protein
MKRFALAFALLFASIPGVASADATQDVKDIRGGRLPVRYEWLGWDKGTAHMRTLVCSEGGTTSCTAAIVKQSDVTTTRVELLSIREVYCDPKSPCAALDTKTVAAFVGKEKAAMASLPALVPGTAVSDPAHLFGTVGGRATTVAVRARDVSSANGPKVIVDLVLKGGARDSAVESLGTLDPSVYRLNSSAMKGAHLTTDGKSAAFAVSLDVGVMCWDFAGLQTVVVDVARKKASLANTIGWKAYQKGDMVGALAGFREATVVDATFGLGWYNRAAVESRDLDLTSAKASFEAAKKLDSSFVKRACTDADFNALRTFEPSLFDC